MKDLSYVIVIGGIFLIPFLPFIVAHESFFPFITGKNFWFRILVEIAFAAWLVLMLLDAQYRPKFSWILVMFGSFVGVIALAAVLGEHAPTSLWSNYERMDGVVTLLHLFLYIVVAGSVLKTEKIWTILLHVSVGVALIVALKGLFAVQTTPGARVDSTLGNAAYMAVYMLFHIFFVALLYVRSKDVWFRLGYLAIALIFVYTMLQTGTRGTFLGLVGGSTVTVLYIALFGAKFPEFRKVAIGGLVGLVFLAGLFFAIRDSEFIQQNSSLSRIANIDIRADLVTRGTIWGMAWQGFEERPVLGWGHGNFNFIFNKYYDPFLHGQEQWFDRTHNLFLDWLIAGGVIGFVTYFGIFGALFYYLIILPLIRKRDNENPNVNVLERGIILGLLVGYLLHNVVVFDNIISYIFFATTIALLHSQVAKPVASVQSYRIKENTVTTMVTPAVLVLLVATVYFVNIPSMLAAKDIIEGMRATTVPARLEAFERALDRGGFGRQEIVEQMSQQAIGIARDPNVPAEQREAFILKTEEALRDLVTFKPNDARIHLFVANFYRATGNIALAREQVEIARSLTPNKPSVMLEQGVVALSENKLEESRDYFKEAFELASEDPLIRVLYAALLIRTDGLEATQAILDEPRYIEAFALNDFAIGSTQQAGESDFLIELFEIRIEKNPNDRQNWVSLAFLYNELGNTSAAVGTMQEAAQRVPEFAAQANCVADNLEAGRDPNTPCT